MCLGAIGMTLIGTSALGQSLGVWSIPVGMAVGALFGALWAGIAGFVKSCFRASEMCIRDRPLAAAVFKASRMEESGIKYGV